MKTIKVIDLLNKIANGEEVPKKIRITDIDDRITRHYNFFYDEDDQEYKDDELFPLGARLILDRVLNKKVEILDKIEEKKIPEKLKNYYDENLEEYVVETYIKGIKYQEIFNSRYDEMIISKINEVLDYLESKGE